MSTKKSKDARYHYNRWLIQAPVGLVIFGLGICLVADAAIYKANGAAVWDWIGYGTLSLIILNSGLCLFGDSILHRVRFERKNPGNQEE